jgi:hypothetical protein
VHAVWLDVCIHRCTSLPAEYSQRHQADRKANISLALAMHTSCYIPNKHMRTRSSGCQLSHLLVTGGTTGVHSTAGSGTRCGSWGHQVVGASSGPGRPSCNPWRLRRGCMLHLDLHVEKRLKVTGVTSLSHPREGLKRNV